VAFAAEAFDFAEGAGGAVNAAVPATDSLALAEAVPFIRRLEPCAQARRGAGAPLTSVAIATVAAASLGPGGPETVFRDRAVGAKHGLGVGREVIARLARAPRALQFPPSEARCLCLNEAYPGRRFPRSLRQCRRTPWSSRQAVPLNDFPDADF
jgi:hypothetical protein